MLSWFTYLVSWICIIKILFCWCPSSTCICISPTHDRMWMHTFYSAKSQLSQLCFVLEYNVYIIQIMILFLLLIVNFIDILRKLSYACHGRIYWIKNTVKEHLVKYRYKNGFQLWNILKFNLFIPVLDGKDEFSAGIPSVFTVTSSTLNKIINATLLFLPLFFMSWTQRSKTFSMYTKGLFLSNIVHKSV